MDVRAKRRLFLKNKPLQNFNIYKQNLTYINNI